MERCKHKESCNPVFRLAFERKSQQIRYSNSGNREEIKVEISNVTSDLRVICFTVEVMVSQIPCLAGKTDIEWIPFQHYIRGSDGRFSVDFDSKFPKKRVKAAKRGIEAVNN